MSPDDVLERHVGGARGYAVDIHGSSTYQMCAACMREWPCDAVSLARQLVAAQTLLRNLCNEYEQTSHDFLLWFASKQKGQFTYSMEAYNAARAALGQP